MIANVVNDRFINLVQLCHVIKALIVEARGNKTVNIYRFKTFEDALYIELGHDSTILSEWNEWLDITTIKECLHVLLVKFVLSKFLYFILI